MSVFSTVIYKTKIHNLKKTKSAIQTIVRFYLRLIVVFVFIDTLQHVRMNAIVLGLVDRLDAARKRGIHRFVIAQLQFHDIPIVQLNDAIALPQHSVTPSRCAAFLAAVPIVGARIVLVCGQKPDRTFCVLIEHPVQLHLLLELIVLEQHFDVVELEQRSIRIARQPVVEVADPENVTENGGEINICRNMNG